MSTPYPYPKLQEDGYELEVVEQEAARNHAFLRYPIPDDTARFGVRPDDVVKLIFRYRENAEKNGQIFNSEHMWVKVIRSGGSYVVGQLDNSPQFTTLLKAGDEIHFHPKHIIRFWSCSEITA